MESFTDGFSSDTPGSDTLNESKIQLDVSLLSRLGMWGCLRCGIVTAKSAQFCLQDEPGRQVDICLFSARMFGAPFASSLPHPVRPCDFATRTILVNERNRRTCSGGVEGQSAVGEGTRTDDASRANTDESDYVWPGIHGLHFGLHREAPNPLQLLMCVRFVCGTLINAGGVVGSGDGSSYGLACLAPLALAEHAAVCVRSVKHTFEIRMMRIGALRLCHRFREASSELAALLRGDRLPADLSATSETEPDDDGIVIVGEDAAASAGGDEDGNLRENESISTILASAVACRPGKDVGFSAGQDGGDNEESTAASNGNGSKHDRKLHLPLALELWVQMQQEQRIWCWVSEDPNNMRPTTAIQ